MKTYSYNIKAIDGSKGLLSLDDKSIKLIYGSPPYPNADRNYGNLSSDEYINWITPFIDAAVLKLSDDGFLVINIKANRDRPKRGSTKRSLVVEKLAILLEEKWQLYCVDIEIWVKDNPVPTGLRSACQDAYEQNLWFSKNPKWFINIDAIRRPYNEQSLRAYEHNEYKPRTNGLSYVRKVKRIDPNPKGALPLNIIRGAVSSAQGIHQAVQPEYLPEKYIKACTKEGDLVVDPWLGSGTTGVVAIKLNRKFAGFDIQQEYVEYARNRFEELIIKLNMKAKLSSDREDLQKQFLDDLGASLVEHSETGLRPLDVIISKPALLRLKVYIFPNTNPHGGRKADEYKFNLNVPGQKRGEKGNFDYSDGLPILISYTEEFGVYIIYDESMHSDFSCNANIQSKQELILRALTEKVAIAYKSSGEELLAVSRRNLLLGIKRWLKRSI